MKVQYTWFPNLLTSNNVGRVDMPLKPFSSLKIILRESVDDFDSLREKNTESHENCCQEPEVDKKQYQTWGLIIERSKNIS